MSRFIDSQTHKQGISNTTAAVASSRRDWEGSNELSKGEVGTLENELRLLVAHSLVALNLRRSDASSESTAASRNSEKETDKTEALPEPRVNEQRLLHEINVLREERDEARTRARRLSRRLRQEMNHDASTTKQLDVMSQLQDQFLHARQDNRRRGIAAAVTNVHSRTDAASEESPKHTCLEKIAETHNTPRSANRNRNSLGCRGDPPFINSEHSSEAGTASDETSEGGELDDEVFDLPAVHTRWRKRNTVRRFSAAQV